MKLTKAQNPYGVSIGQKWVSKDKRRQRKFLIDGIGSKGKEFFAHCKYQKVEKKGGKNVCVVTHTRVNLLRFGEYKLVK